MDQRLQDYQAINAYYNQRILDLTANLITPTVRWQWNGMPCDIKTFSELAYGKNTEQQTAFLLKYDE